MSLELITNVFCALPLTIVAFACALSFIPTQAQRLQRSYNRGFKQAMRNARVDARNRAYLCGMRAADKAWRNDGGAQ